MGIEQYQIKFEYIKGIKNTLANTVSRQIFINPDTCQDLEPRVWILGIGGVTQCPYNKESVTEG